MSRVQSFISSHRRLLFILLILFIAFAIFVLVWFQPQKLFYDEKVDEAIPQAAPTEAIDEDDSGTVDDSKKMEGEEAEKAEPKTLASGPFQSLEHGTTGRAVIIELADGRRFLRFEDLDTSNGPDLRVYLSEIPASDDWYAYGERFVDLGGLKGNEGDQNYQLPENIDLAPYKSAVIWCRRFSVGFGVAPLDRT